jgi:hypothetical protein
VPNVEANIKDTDALSRVHIADMDWMSPALDRFVIPFDIIVAGECCYEPRVIDPLMRVLWNVSSDSTEIYLCGIVSEMALTAFNLCVGKYFDVERIDQASLPAEDAAAERTVGSRMNSDDPASRLRAFMRLHRRAIDPNLALPPSSQACASAGSGGDLAEDLHAAGGGKRSEGGGIIYGPEMLNGELEVQVCRCPRLLLRELTHVFSWDQLKPEGDILAVPTFQHSVMDLVQVGSEVEVEKDRCLEAFMDFAKVLCVTLRAEGYWADYIDPCSGLPMLTPNTTKVYSEVDGAQALMGFATMDAGMCKILLHPKWGSSVYPASAFTNAPLESISKAIARASDECH